MKYARTPSVLQLFFNTERLFYFINTQKTHKHEASATEIYKSKDVVIYIIINEKCAWYKLNVTALN